MRRAQTLIVVLLLAVLSVPVAGVKAQNGNLCFNVPGINDCITGIFAEYWQGNGGLPVFGYPISPAQQRPTESGQSTSTQFFERNSLEINVDPAAQRPFHILLGRLGDSLLQRQGRSWRAEGGTPNPWPGSACKSFNLDGQERSVCGPFLEYWQGHGLDLGDPRISERESTMLFGLPLTAPKMETNPDGANVMTQWFERARFEYHPNNPAASRVLLGLLGKEFLAPGTTPPAPTPPAPTPPAPPADPCANIAPPKFAVIEPNCVRQGGEIQIGLFGFQPNEEFSFWITKSSGETIGSTTTAQADEDGIFIGTLSTASWGVPGDYVFVAQDVGADYEPSIAPFRIIP